MDEYLPSSDMVMLLERLEERYGFTSDIEEAVACTVQDDNVRRYLWVGTQKLEISGYKTLRIIADLIVAAIAEEIDIVNLESSYYKELLPDYLDWACWGEQPNTFAEILSAISRDRFCDEAFAEILKDNGFVVGKADYCGCRGTYYVEDRIGNRIWFDNVLVKNNITPVRHRRPRIEVLQAMAYAKILENDITKKP
jgi:hypothetical protein